MVRRSAVCRVPKWAHAITTWALCTTGNSPVVEDAYLKWTVAFLVGLTEISARDHHLIGNIGRYCVTALDSFGEEMSNCPGWFTAW